MSHFSLEFFSCFEPKTKIFFKAILLWPLFEVKKKYPQKKSATFSAGAHFEGLLNWIIVIGKLSKCFAKQLLEKIIFSISIPPSTRFACFSNITTSKFWKHPWARGFKNVILYVLFEKFTHLSERYRSSMGYFDGVCFCVKYFKPCIFVRKTKVWTMNFQSECTWKKPTSKQFHNVESRTMSWFSRFDQFHEGIRSFSHQTLSDGVSIGKSLSQSKTMPQLRKI